MKTQAVQRPGDANTPGDDTENDSKKKLRLPHEHDESSDSQTSGPRGVIEQARRDVESGQEDTDLRGSRGQRRLNLHHRDRSGS